MKLKSEEKNPLSYTCHNKWKKGTGDVAWHQVFIILLIVLNLTQATVKRGNSPYVEVVNKCIGEACAGL